MLLDRYDPDPRFWAIIEHLAIEMEPELAQIDKILADDELFQPREISDIPRGWE